MSYYRYGRSANNFEVTENVTYEGLASQHKALSKMINNLIHHSNLDQDTVKAMRAEAKKNPAELIKHNKTLIQQKAALLSRVDTYGFSNQATTTNYVYEEIKTSLTNLIYSAMIRQECILVVQKDYLELDEIQVSADKSAIKADEFWWNIKTDIGYQNKIILRGKKDADPLTYDYEEELEDRKCYSTGKMQKQIRESTLTYHINQDWYDNVYKKGIARSDIGGKAVLVTSAKEIEEHELKDQSVKLFDCTTIYTKLPVGTNTWRMPSGSSKKHFFIEPRHIAVQTLPSGETVQASGKDKSWAIRTMKMRMKASMLKQMGVK